MSPFTSSLLLCLLLLCTLARCAAVPVSAPHYSWSELGPTSPFGPRLSPTVTWNGASLLLIGGAIDQLGTPANDIYSSPDGEQWTYVGLAPFLPRVDHTCNFDAATGRMWVVAGDQPPTGTQLADVWMSPDAGVTWQQQTAAAPFQARYAHGTAYVNSTGLLYVMGGIVPTNPAVYPSDVWSSGDGGVSWHLVTANARWAGRSDFTLSWIGSALVLTGGWYYSDPGSVSFNEVWSWSGEAAQHWSLISSLPQPTSNAHSVFDGQQLHLIGGVVDGSTCLSSVSSSSDGGLSWSTAQSQFLARDEFAVAFDGSSMYVIAGWDPTLAGRMLSDVWTNRTQTAAKPQPAQPRPVAAN